MMSKRIKFKGQLNSYIKWPIWLSLLMIFVNAYMFVIDVKAGAVMAAFSCVYLIISLSLYFRNRTIFFNEMISFATQYGQVQRQLLRSLEIPYALLDESGRIIWTNESFETTLHIKKGYRKSILSILPEIKKENMPNKDFETECFLTHQDRDYRVSMRKVSMQDMMSNSLISGFDSDSFLIAMFLFDETQINKYARENDEQKLAVGLIYLDNYEEALESVEEVRRSLLVALIDRKINKYFSTIDGLVRKLEKDKYLVLTQKRGLESIREMRFEILEDVKTVNIGNEMAVTLSIGIGQDGDTYMSNYEYARNAIDLALGRGGDQAIVKTPSDIYYYGGKSQKAEKNTRVKARVKAHALREIIEGKDKIVIMGHKIIDVDAFGAAIGVYRAAKTFGKKTHIVINDITTSIRPLIDSFKHDADYDEDLFVTNSEAMEMIDTNTVLVVVDVNRPSYTECKELIDLCQTIVVLDHHRQSSEKIEKATLSYIEPYASSASEMIAEILQYISDAVKLKPVEADCIYSGIMIDTNNFMTKTGVRTFEAAAYLRRNGADVTRVRKLFRDDMVDYKARAEAVRHAEVFNSDFAISKFESEGIESPTVVGAQAANELLNINGIKASFVLTEYNGKVYISARSIDEINVQIIMERMGGGGHINIAGAQIPGVSLDEAKQMLTQTLTNMLKEGEI
ncbi:MAG: DHH family phosphoesterase [Clostridia bacterium]|nr:DHH family phosphoesterase [Clostridia bacterium]